MDTPTDPLLDTIIIARTVSQCAEHELQIPKTNPSIIQKTKSAFKLPDTTKSGTDLHKPTGRGIGNLTFLQNRWTDVRHNSSFLKWIKQAQHLHKSKRRDVKQFTGAHIVWDTVKYGYCKSPKMNYNPYVRTSLIRAAASERKKEELPGDDAAKTKDTVEKANETETVRTTLPIYNGGTQVRLRKCDRNTHRFLLKKGEWITSWLSFEVCSDRIMTSGDDFIGAVSIDLNGVQQVGQMYYTQLPLINKRHLSRQIQMKAEQKFRRKLAKQGKTLSKLNILTDKIRYHTLRSEDLDFDVNIDSEEEENHNVDLDEIVPDHQHLNIAGTLHVKAIKKPISENMQKKNQTYELEIEILAITDMTTLQLEPGLDSRRFYGGLLGFVLYLLFYAIIMFVAEIETSTGMNEYKESIWFALITVTTLGYGDIYAQTKYSKVLNGLFISINVIIIAGFLSNLLGYVVEAGEQALDHRMDHMMNGAENVFKNQQKLEKAKLDRVVTRKLLLKSQQNTEDTKAKERHPSVSSIPSHATRSQNREHQRRKSEPVNVSNIVEEDTKEENKQQQIARIEEVKAIEVTTTKATKLKLNELTKLDTNEKQKFTTQIYLNLFLFALVVLFGFFTLGVAVLLTGPNYLTNLPYYGYPCKDNDPLCQLDKSVATVFVDSLYFTIVSMTTVGYGDIYPKSSALARVFGSLFVLFGTLMLVRLLDLISDYMIWKQNFAKTKRNLGKILTSSQEFFEFDLDHNGSVDKYEFLVGMLLKLDIVDMERIDEIMSIFHATDRDGNGVVDRRELKQKIAEDYMKLQWGQNAWKEIDREWKSIKIAQGQITNDKKKLKTKQQELNLKIKKFEKDKKEWHINRHKMQNNNDTEEESIPLSGAVVGVQDNDNEKENI